MLVANLYHIKSPNGLFYYAADYLNELQHSNVRTLVRKSLAAEAKSTLTTSTIIPCSFAAWLAEMLAASLGKAFVYTPTPHPFPFAQNQLAVLHDSFPFLASSGKFKKHLLKLSCSLSKCSMGYINSSDARRFLLELGIPPDRLVFTPNKIPEVGPRRTRDRQKVLTVGLVGTDSPKKNYEQLISFFQSQDIRDKINFHIYGTETDYYLHIFRSFNQNHISLIDSRFIKLEDFLSEVDLVASASVFEGFGRPLAAALCASVPCLMVDTPVFSEFYPAICRCDGISDLAGRIRDLTAGITALPQGQSGYWKPASLAVAYKEAAAFLEHSSQCRL